MNIFSPHLAYLCSSTSWGGLEMNQLRNAKWMSERGHRVTILCKENSPIAQACTTENIPVAFVSDHRKYYDFKAGRKLAKILNDLYVTHLVIRDTRDMSVSVIAKRKAHHPVHLSYFMEMQLGVSKKGLPHTLRFKYLDLWSCPLNWLAEQVRTMTRFDQNKIVVIPSGLELSRFNQDISREQARKILELPQEGTIIGLSGRFDPQKGQLLLLQAMVLAKRDDFSICFLGEPTKDEGLEYFERINSFIRDHHLENRVFIRPFRKDIEVFYKAINAFVMASRAETFGMVTIEALASGTPVIASNSGGSPEILGHGKYGMLFRPLDAQSLSETITQFLSGAEFPSELLEKASSVYDHHEVCQQVEKALLL
jgi:glycosyltransferase involved in cell wall biosynthesis